MISISITNGTSSGNLYPATVSGTYETEVLSLVSGDYTIRIYGLTRDYFDCVVDASLVQTSSEYDSEKMFDWLLDQMANEAATGSGASSQSVSLLAAFVEIIEGTEKHKCNLGTDFKIEELSDDTNNYYLRFHRVDGDYFDFTIAKTEGAVQNGIDPKKLLLWLLKKLKEALCPECS